MGIVSNEAFVANAGRFSPQISSVLRYARIWPQCHTPELNFAEIARLETVARGREVLRGLGERVQINREDALKMYGVIRNYIREAGYINGKYLRPWEIDPTLYANLDRSKPWWGFEFETGYVSKEARTQVIDHVWDNFNNVCFDAEGEGQWAVEITFQPEEAEKYLNGTAAAYKFMEYINANKNLTYRSQEDGIGTHINMSHPALNGTNSNRLAWSLSRTIAALPLKLGDIDDVRKYMFGRSRLYGGCFARTDGGSEPARAAAHWIEGKLFRTTYDLEEYKKYIKVCEALSACMDLFLRTPEGSARPYVNNLYEMAFEGAEPELKYSDTAPYIDGTRNGGAINGTYARDAVDNVSVPLDYEEEDEDEYDEDDGLVWCDECDDYH